MSTLDLKSQISTLAKLQTIDSEIYSLRQEKEAKPEQIKLVEAVFEEKKQQLLALEKKLLDVQKQKKDKELECATKEESGKKLQAQLFSLKTNKEYQTMLQQIQDSKADASVIEDKILELMDLADKAKAEVDKEKERLKGEEKIFLEQKKVVELRVKEIDDRLAQLEGQRKQACPGIDSKVLAQYERILHSRDGLAIVCVIHDACGGCNMSVPAQVTNLIKMYERLITCEMCNRILYIREELP